MSGAVFLIVDARVRYWEDAEINGVADEAGVLIPLREGDSWRPVIELATGKILGWPQGTTADIHFKVCDAGDYWLADSEGGKIAKWRGDYVPDKFLAVGDSGFGNYIILRVSGEGLIEGWSEPFIECNEWRALK